ncbi:tyrosine-type recombinase/integrase [Calothrix sp. FACHB-156]|nr:tyrosine-type recombinase/integrase [Nostoc linckia FACHB-104]MBD2336949.1 tyrosine-type recombinase/integrase [Calothrix sp. FACHB-156]
MVNASKTPSGKAKKGQVTVRPDSGSIKACFPRNYFADGKQVKLGTGINPDDWEATAAKLQRRLQLELEDGKLATDEGIFNLGRYQEILEEYGLRAKLRLVRDVVTSDDQLPPKPQLSLMEIWDMYCEYKKRNLRESVYEGTYRGIYKNYIKSAIEATNSEDAIKIRNWLVENRYLKHVKNLISNLSKAYQLGIKNKLLSHNPYEGMTEEIGQIGAKGKQQNEIETDDDVEDSLKAYTWQEAQTILEYIENNSKIKHWYPFTKFKFLTGCRTGETIGLRWNDVDWNNEIVVFKSTYDQITKKWYPLKNDRTYKGSEVRKFPMPKNGELWNLLKSIPQGEPSDVVFKSRDGKIIVNNVFRKAWTGRNSPSTKLKGIIPELIKKGKLTKYLPPYNTRHTFINHAIHDLGIPEKIVCYMCGHKPDVSNKHYQDEAIFMKGINPEIPFSQQQFATQQIDNQQSKIETLEEQLRQQQEIINRLLQERNNNIIK